VLPARWTAYIKLKDGGCVRRQWPRQRQSCRWKFPPPADPAATILFPWQSPAFPPPKHLSWKRWDRRMQGKHRGFAEGRILRCIPKAEQRFVDKAFHNSLL